MRYSQTGFEGNESDGNFLWKIAVSNFQAVVHIKVYDILAFNFVGLMARQFTNDGGPYGTRTPRSKTDGKITPGGRGLMNSASARRPARTSMVAIRPATLPMVKPTTIGS